MRRMIMKKNMFGRVVTTTVLTGAAIFSLTACGSSGESASTAASASTETEAADTAADTADSSAAADTDGVRTIYIGASASNYPLEYTEDDGTWTGYEVEVLKKVDEELDQYEFEFVDASTQDSVYTGLNTGKYQIAITNAFYTDERASNFNIPENQIGASPCGLIVRNENADIKTLEQAQAAGLSLTPLAAGDGLTYQIELFNKEHPDSQIDLQYADASSQWTDAILWVAEGRYDFTLVPATFYEALVTAEDGAFHEYDDVLSFDPVIPVKTYSIVAKEETQLSDDISEVLGQFYDDGTLADIAQTFYGFNPFDLNSDIGE
jgi:L-cystine transport system substrate-binding protein